MKYIHIFVIGLMLLSGCATGAPQAASQGPSRLDEGIYINNPYQVIKPQWLYNPDDPAAASAIYASLPGLQGVGISAATAKELYPLLPLERLAYLEMRSTAPEDPQGAYIHIYPSDLSFALWLDQRGQEATLQVAADEYHIYTLNNESFEAIAQQLGEQIADNQKLPPAPIHPESSSPVPEKKNPSP